MNDQIQLMSRGNVESDLMKLQIIIKNELNNDIMVNRFIINEVSYFGPGARKELPTVVAKIADGKSFGCYG